MPFQHLEAVLAEARPMAEAFDEAGRRLYLVGGIVRELWLDAAIDADTDLDLTTDATPQETKMIIKPLASALWLQGERFGTVGATIDGRAYETTTHRVERYFADSRKPQVEFATAIKEDLSRRDFTINAMAIEIATGEIIDPFEGIADLGSRRLRTPLDPEISLADDPLRMMRAARFVAGLDLEPDLSLVEAMSALADRLDIVSAERIGVEFDKLLALPDPAAGVRLLDQTGLLGLFLPEAAGAAMDRSIDRLSDLPDGPELRLAALLFETTPSAAAARIGALRHSAARRRWTATVLETAQRLARGEVCDPASMRRWVARSQGTVEPARGIVANLAPQGEELVAASVVLERGLGAELDDLGPALTGQQVMDALDLPPGAAVGEALDFLQELRFDEGPLEPDEATTRLKAWWGQR
ncbi:MAG: hypothetical protein ACR2PK_03405 [Acidimicrobiales bacterium]